MEKKGFFARINEALYETVGTGEKEPAPETAADAGGQGPAPGGGAPAADQSLENPSELAAKVRAGIAGRGQPFTQFLVLVMSFAEIIPEESGRYRAAMKALEKTGNITRKEVLQAANDQLRAVGSQREVFAGAVGRKREALSAQGGGVEAIRAQIAELEQNITRLRQEEQELLRSVAAEEGKIKAAEEGFTALLSTMEAEIRASQEKIEKYLPE